MRVWVALTVLAIIAAGCSSGDTASAVLDIDEPTAEVENNLLEAQDDQANNELTESDAQESGSEGNDGTDEDTVELGDDSALTEPAPVSPLCEAAPVVPGTRPDVDSSGNRIAPGTIDFTTLDEIAVELPDDAIWVTADPSQPGGWYVTLSRGSSVRVSADGQVTSDAGPGAQLPPELDNTGTPLSPFRHHDLFNTPLPDTRVVVAESIAAALVQPTERYPHAVLGDAVEAAGVQWVDTCSGESGIIELDEPDVIEGISPILSDVDSDGQLEIVVTISNANVGARLAAFELDGTLTGESAPIGQGNRWRNQLAVGPFGPEGQVELISVRTPHIGGIVEAFRLVPAEIPEGDASTDETLPGEFIPVAESNPIYTSHVIGERNLSLGIATDVNGDGIPDVLVPSADRQSVAALTRTSELDGIQQGWNVVGQRELQNTLTGNIAAQEATPGTTTLAVPDGDILRLWR